MKEAQQRGETMQQNQQTNSEISADRGRVYRSGDTEKRIGRLTQTVYGEGDMPRRVRRTPEQPEASGKKRTPEQPEVSRKKHTPEQPDTSRKKRTPEQPDTSGKKRTPEQPDTSERKYVRRAQKLAEQERNHPEQAETKEAKQQPQQTGSIGGWKEKMAARRKWKARMVLGGMLGVIAVVYAAVAVYFGFHFYEGTEIYGIDCSQLTADEVKAEAAAKLDEYVLTIEERENKTETLTAEQIGLKFVDNSSIDQMLRAQHCYIWPIMMLLDRDPVVSVAFEYDKQLVKNSMNQLECFDKLRAVDPKDSYVLLTDTGYVIEKEIMGTTLDYDKTIDIVMEALDAGVQTVSLEEKECYVNPQVYSDDEEMKQIVEAKNQLLRANITYDMGSAQEVLNAVQIAEWIVELSDGSYVIDDTCVYEYVEAMAAKYDTFGLPITFYTSIGTTETLSGGDYGWCIDQDQTVLELLQALDSGFQGTMEPAYLYTGMSHENNGIGYTYVEICISQQRMWCYENGHCVVDTPVVTGNPNKGHGTPSGGVWAIDAMKREAILEGEGYAEPVDYWMPFNEDVGIHDFKERAHFGSTIYLTNGSHGCVNTPYEAVQTIYSTVSIGTPVIVYE